MIISFSSIKQFRKCSRQWAFKNFAESRSEEDSFRRELFLLSKLQSLWAWRGNLVDYVISRRVVPALKNNWFISKDSTVGFARDLFEKQMRFARENRLREPGMKPSAAGEEFAALSEIDYEGSLSSELVAGAWNDVEAAITNLLEMAELLDTLRRASNLIAQRALTFDHSGFTFRAFPDLIAFFSDQPPLIVDWKVHLRAMADYRLQLALYALALKRCEPHKDFAKSLDAYESTDIRLIEVQLLTKAQREYFLTEDDLREAENFVTEAAMEIELAIDEKSSSGLDPYDLPITSNPDNCERCVFRKVCMETEAICSQPTQMSFQF